ncbi:MAG TPA: heparan-alpha-glucosaminide N-acetyltransferase domain-containing protein [Polyangia bacterium]|nr:heparan-alpha-glucosaminide N-acetyltransferase domain-containing protein [Polyangia bacterium]
MPALPAPGSPPGAPQAAPRPRKQRIDAVDWLRGLAVVLMIQTHLYDSWCSPAAKLTVEYGWTRFWGGMPSRLFLLLVGVSMAIRYEHQMASGTDRPAMVRTTMKRGLEILGLAYLFRLQEYLLGGAYDWHDLFRVDILNCIGASMIVAAFISAPRRGRPQIAVTALVAAVCVALGPIVGPHHFPDFLPRPLTSYLGGERPMSWFPLFPWLAWPLIGVLVGHAWVRGSTTARRQAWTFVITAAVGAVLIETVVLLRPITHRLIHYPNWMVQQMGPEVFVHRLGIIGPMALLGYLVTRFLGTKRFSLMRLFGQTSLFVYWVHVELVYGLLFKKLHGALSMRAATVALALMIGAMAVLAELRLRYWKGWPSRRKLRANLPAAPSPL